MKRRQFFTRFSSGVGALLASRHAMGTETPGAEANSPSLTWTRELPVRHSVDVAVIGGGIAGAAAACAAAKSGVSVLLVERFAITGGDLTTGGVANFCGKMEGQGEFFDEVVRDLKAFDALDGSGFHYEILALVLQEMLLRRGVKLLLHTRFVDAVVREGRITECVVCGKSGPEAVRARQFIDCTGDGDVARMAGFSTMKGRPSDGFPLPMSLMFFVRHLDGGEAVRPMLPEGWFDPVRRAEDLPMTSVWPDGPGANALKVKIPMFDATDTEGLTAAEIRGRRRMMEVLDYYQRVEKKPWRLDHCSPIIGIREGCRIMGDQVLRVGDLRAGRRFDDAVAMGTFYLDGHKPDDDKRTYILPKDELEVPPYQIPLGCLIAKDGRNLMMAGRCFSADQLALSSARVSTTCSMMGQAAGITAAFSAKAGRDPRELDPAVVRKAVEERGADLAV